MRGHTPADGHVHLQYRGVMRLQGGQNTAQVGGPQVEKANHQGQDQQRSLLASSLRTLQGLVSRKPPIHGGRGQLQGGARGSYREGPRAELAGSTSLLQDLALPRPQVQTTQEARRGTGSGKETRNRKKKAVR